MQNLHRRFLQIILSILLLGVAAFAHPGSGILVDRLGQIYFIDTGSGLWKIDSRGAVSRLSTLRNHWLAMDPTDRFIQSRVPTDSGGDWVITPSSSNPTILISTDFPLLIGQDGNLYYPSVRESNVRILRRAPEGGTTTFATLPRSVTGAALGWINGIAAGPGGSIYYTENNSVRRISPQGAVSTLATIAALANGPSIPGSETRPYLRGLKIDANGVVYVTDAADARVLKITTDGKVTTILQLESPWAPTDVAIFGDIVYVLEYSHTEGDDRVAWMPRVRKMTGDGRSTIIMTVDQMPGARPAAPAMSFNFFDLLLRTFLFAPRPV